MIGAAIGLGLLLTIGYVAGFTELMDVADTLLIFGLPLLLVVGWIVLRYRKRHR